MFVPFILFALAEVLLAAVPTSECPYGRSLSFTKVAGFSPKLNFDPEVLYSAPRGTAISAECYNRCKGSRDCSGVVVDYGRTTCFRVPGSGNITELVYAPEVSYFSKACLPVAGNCTDRAWSIDYTPGYELIGFQHTVLSNIIDRLGCVVACLSSSNKTGEPCLSANFHALSKTCTLSSRTKWTNPDSLIPTTQGQSEYIENQCVVQLEKPPCWHDPVHNLTSLRSDLQIFNITQQECARRCASEMYFACRGYSYFVAAPFQCLLHSDPLLMLVGPTLQPPLTSALQSVYVEVIACIDMSVTCDSSRLDVTLRSAAFGGRLFVQGDSDRCGVQGRGGNVTTLSVPMPSGDSNPCHLSSKLAIGDVNRTLVSTVVVVQYHQLIQTVNDRVVRVTCLLTESLQPTSNNLTLAATFNIQEPQAQSEITGVGGAVVYNGTAAKAAMQVLDQRTGQLAKDVQLGDPLQLRITVDPPFNVSVVRAGHLVATSGSSQDSKLLLDWRGCPPEAAVFPPLMPLDPRTLVADFKAFRFPSSPVLMLSVVLTICTRICQPTDCGNGMVSYGRRKRAALEVYKEMPLHLAIVVHAPNVLTGNYSDVQSASFGSIGGAQEEERLQGEVCLSFIALALIVLFWLLVQCVIVAVFCCLHHRQRERHADTISLRHDFQPRHVTWADDTEIPSKNLRLSTSLRT